MAELEVLAFRIAQLEMAHGQLRDELHNDYLDKHQVMNEYTPRHELRRHAATRREWPLMLAALAATASSIASLVITIGGH